MTAVELGVTCGTLGVAVMVSVGGMGVDVGKKVASAVADAVSLAVTLSVGVGVTDATSGKLQARIRVAASNNKNSLRFIFAPRRLSYLSSLDEAIGNKTHISSTVLDGLDFSFCWKFLYDNKDDGKA